jgi:hypothetical protein
MLTCTRVQAEEIPELSQGRLLELVNTLLTKERDLLLKVRAILLCWIRFMSSLSRTSHHLECERVSVPACVSGWSQPRCHNSVFCQLSLCTLVWHSQVRGPRAVQWDPSREGRVDANFSYAFNNGWVPGTLNTSLSTNAVMRT